MVITAVAHGDQRVAQENPKERNKNFVAEKRTQAGAIGTDILSTRRIGRTKGPQAPVGR